MQKKTIIGAVIVLAVIAGFYFLNSYIYKEKQADFVAGDTVTKSGQVLAVDLSQATFDGPYLLTLWSEDDSVSTIAVPSMGLALCAAYQNKNIGDVYLIKAGDQMEVRGTLNEDGAIVPCESKDHYLRPSKGEFILDLKFDSGSVVFR